MIQETRRTLASHTPVYFAGDRATDLVRVERGVVMVFNLFEDGRRQIVDFVTAGELLHFQFLFDRFRSQSRTSTHRKYAETSETEYECWHAKSGPKCGSRNPWIRAGVFPNYLK